MVVSIPFSIENSSAGSPINCHCLTVTGSASTPGFCSIIEPYFANRRGTVGMFVLEGKRVTISLCLVMWHPHCCKGRRETNKRHRPSSYTCFRVLEVLYGHAEINSQSMISSVEHIIVRSPCYFSAREGPFVTFQRKVIRDGNSSLLAELHPSRCHVLINVQISTSSSKQRKTC